MTRCSLPVEPLVPPPIDTACTFRHDALWRVAEPNILGVPHPSFFCVQSHDILYEMSRDMVYTPARA